ncbi:hypothetical protein [Caballeronia arationis]|jgi:hypothetical protein|uniref:hypothetical protein n=1 Tax=Caballeronia arationis TaxID=1777142 RepID=UPI000BE37824|nr:hypothetical protein [Caballeronia arationis]
MVSKPRTGKGKSAIVSDEQQTIAQYVPDLQNWPASWRVDDEDISVGREIVAILTPFLEHLLTLGYARKTLLRHRDHIWMLGGEMIRHRHENPDRLALPAEALLDELIEEDGGPLIWPTITESEQNSFDATCRKLYQYRNRASLG